MTFYINAWLNRINPFVSVCDRENGEELLRLEEPELQKHMANGDLYLSDFCTNHPPELQTLVKELLLLRCCHVLNTNLDDLSQQLKQRRPKVIALPRQHDTTEAANTAEATNDPHWQPKTRQVQRMEES